MSKIKYFIILMSIILLSLSVCAAVEDTNNTQTDVQYTEHDTQSYNDENYLIEKNDNNYEQTDNEINTDKNIQKKNNNEKLKAEGTTNITTITQDNYNDYLKITNGNVKLNQNYFVPGNNYTINFTYLPTEANQLSVNNFYSNKYKNDTIKIAGTINDVALIVDKGGFNNIILEDLTVNYNPEYEGDYVNVTSAVLNRVTINVDTQRETFSIPLTIKGGNSVVENSTIHANVPSTQIDWYNPPNIPKGIGVWIQSNNVILANNIIEVTESTIIQNNESYYRSLYGIYSSGSYTTISNNTILLNGTQYSYGVVIRSLNNKIYDNNIKVISDYYAAGVNIEGNGIKNNLMCNNIINVSSGYGVTNQGNPDVAYACLILDFSCGGENYYASSSSAYNNSYCNNTIIADGRQVYGLEVWGGVNATFSGNTMYISGTLPMGIGAIGINTTIDNNTIYVEGTSNSTEGSADYIRPRTAGIYAFGMKEGNTITNNTLCVTNGRALLLDKAKNLLVEDNFILTENYVYAIEVDDINNTFKYNALVGDKEEVEELIKDTSNRLLGENYYINNREPTNTSLSIIAPEYLLVNDETNITVSLKDTEENSIPGQYITVQVGDDEAQTLITDEKGNIKLPFTSNTNKTVLVNATYKCYGDYGSSTTKMVNIVNSIKHDTVFAITMPGEVTVNKTVPVTIELLDEYDNLVNNVTINMTVDGHTDEVYLRNGITVYQYTPTSLDGGVFVFTFEGNDTLNPVTYNPQINVTPDKNAIIEELNNTLQEMNRDCIITIDNIPDIKYNDNLTVHGKLLDTGGVGIANTELTVTLNTENTTVTTDDNGLWSLRVNTRTLGTNNITATYTGEEYNEFETSSSFNINQTEAIITIDKTIPTQYSENVTITGTFKNSNRKAIGNSKIKVTINGVSTYVKTDSNGVWILTVKANKTGTNNITAYFGGNQNYAKYTATSTFEVTKQDLKITGNIRYDNGNLTVTGTFVDKNAKALSNSKVRLNINGQAVYVKTDCNGTYTYSTIVTVKTITYYLYYGGNSNYNSYTGSKTTLTVA